MYVVLGALGHQGEAILHYLFNTTLNKADLSIVAMDIAEAPHNTINTYMFDKNYDVRYLQCNISKEWSDSSYDVFDKIKDPNVTIVNCLPTEYIYGIFKHCLYKRWNLIDLGGITEITVKQMELNKSAKNCDITVVTDCGLAPGIVLSRVSEISSDSSVRGIKVYCCGIPKYPEPPLSYLEVFYMDGVRKEYSGIAQEIVDGELRSFPALSGKEYVAVPSLGVLEARRTSGGLSVGPERLNLNHLSYKTLRYPGHWDYVEKYIMPQKDPTAVLKSMTDIVSPENPDIIYLAFHIDYIDDTEIEEYFWEYDYENNISAMAQATGFTAAAVARKVHDGEIDTGVLGMDEISANEIIGDIKNVMLGQYRQAPIEFKEEE